MKILITGSKGYIGSYLCEYLKEDYEIVEYDLKEGHDILDEDQLYHHMKGCNAVIHLAAIVGDPLCALNPGKAIKVNQEGTEKVVRIAKHLGIKKLIYASTCSIYGTNHREVCGVLSAPNPLSIYAWTKFVAERIVINDGYTALRFGTAYGISPNMRYNLVINSMYKNAIDNGELWVENGDNFRPFTHIKSIAKEIKYQLRIPVNPLKNVYDFNATLYQVANFMSYLTKAKIIDKGNSNDRRSYRVR